MPKYFLPRTSDEKTFSYGIGRVRPGESFTTDMILDDADLVREDIQPLFVPFVSTNIYAGNSGIPHSHKIIIFSCFV